MMIIGWCIRLIFLCVVVIAIVNAEETPTTTLDELEQYEAVRLVDENAASGEITKGSILKQFNLQVLHKKFACLKAIGHEEFCHCISENMPSDQEFANYVVAVSKTKQELNFDQLSDYYQQSINLARTARDKCVSETM